MSKTISTSQLGEAIAEMLTLYREEKIEQVNAIGEEAIKKLVGMTQKSAPARPGGGRYKKSITYIDDLNPVTGDKEYTWGAKAPQHRLTHLLVKGHATPDGGRTRGDSFLEDAMDVVLPEYEKAVEEALKSD